MKYFHYYCIFVLLCDNIQYKIHNVLFIVICYKATILYFILRVRFVVIPGDYKKYIQQDSYRNYMLSATGDTVRIDLSKKPQDVPEASFRKLNVD